MSNFLSSVLSPAVHESLDFVAGGVTADSLLRLFAPLVIGIFLSWCIWGKDAMFREKLKPLFLTAGTYFIFWLFILIYNVPKVSARLSEQAQNEKLHKEDTKLHIKKVKRAGYKILRDLQNDRPDSIGRYIDWQFVAGRVVNIENLGRPKNPVDELAGNDRARAIAQCINATSSILDRLQESLDSLERGNDGKKE